MTQALLNSLTEKERELIAETEPDALTGLDEDALLELHTRIRRARNKYTKLYRRQASAGVAEHGGRGFSYAKNQRNRDKAEVFELALARVSKRVEVVAKQAAAELRRERLAAARAGRGAGPASRSRPATDAVPERQVPPTTSQDHGRDEEGCVDARHGSPPSGRARQPLIRNFGHARYSGLECFSRWCFSTVIRGVIRSRRTFVQACSIAVRRSQVSHSSTRSRDTVAFSPYASRK